MRFEALASALFLVGCGENLTPQPESPVEVTTCRPNLDGVFDYDELKVSVGVSGYVLASANPRPISVAGVVDERGTRIFAFDDAFDDPVSAFGAVSTQDRWYQSSFPPDAFTLTEPGATVDTIYTQDATALLVHGVASREENPPEGKTLIVYETPVPVHQYPMALGSELGGAGRSRQGAVLRGLPYAGTDRWSIRVAAAGEMLLPDVALLGVHRLDIRLETTTEPSVGAPIVHRASSFLFECLGEVARFAGPEASDNPDLGTTVSSKRFTLRKDES